MDHGAAVPIAGIAPQWQAAFGYAASINRFAAQPGHTAQLMADGAEARARMLADMDAAQHEINVLYYIWLADHTGTAVAQALVRAARRGVVCRAMVDGLGSRALLRTDLWQQMAQAGVQLAVALPTSHPIRVMFTSRLDLRNHRKITVIDQRITYCGSQNCADEAFAVKARYAPWVDVMLRMQGPVVAQMQQVFASDWAQARSVAQVPPMPLAVRSANGLPDRPADGFAAVVMPKARPSGPLHLAARVHAAGQRTARGRDLHPLHSRRHGARGPVRRRLARRAGQSHPARAQRFVDRGRGQPQHLPLPAACRRHAP